MQAVLLTIRDFVAAGLRPRSWLAKAVVAMLCFKLCIVLFMRLFLFNGGMAESIDDSMMSRRLVPPASAHQEK